MNEISTTERIGVLTRLLARLVIGEASVPDVTLKVRQARILKVDRAAVRQAWRQLGLIP